MTTQPQTVSQDIKKSFEYVHWDVKIYSISLDTHLDSTTLFMLVYLFQNVQFDFMSTVSWKGLWTLIASVSGKIQ